MVKKLEIHNGNQTKAIISSKLAIAKFTKLGNTYWNMRWYLWFDKRNLAQQQSIKEIWKKTNIFFYKIKIKITNK